jgi:hypothetical protein
MHFDVEKLIVFKVSAQCLFAALFRSFMIGRLT